MLIKKKYEYFLENIPLLYNYLEVTLNNHNQRDDKYKPTLQTHTNTYIPGKGLPLNAVIRR